MGDLDQLTVEAWARCDASRPEALQPLVSQWKPLDSPSFAAYDATSTDGLICAGYYGAVFDGRYVYCCPIRSHRSRDSVHGHVLRCDTHGDFRDPASWEAYDAGGTSGLNTVCYYGAAFDGRYVEAVGRRVYVRAEMELDAKSAPMVREDAAYTITTEGVLGERYVEISPGVDGAPNAEDSQSRKALQAKIAEMQQEDEQQVISRRRFGPRKLGRR